MVLTTRDHSVIIENMVTRLCDHLDEKYGLDPEMRSAMQESPSVALLDRAMAFRTEPWYSEVRAALERVESKRFGKCVCCARWISMETLVEAPTARLCERCARQAERRGHLSFGCESAWMFRKINKKGEGSLAE